MTEEKLTKLFIQAGNSLQAIFEYFRLKNKVLWEGVQAAGTSFTVPNLSKYQTVTVVTRYGSMVVDVSTGLIQGLHSDNMGGNALADSMIVSRVKATITGDKMSLLFCDYTAFISGTARFYSTLDVRKIIGLEPKLPETLQKIIGGGTA